MGISVIAVVGVYIKKRAKSHLSSLGYRNLSGQAGGDKCWFSLLYDELWGVTSDCRWSGSHTCSCHKHDTIPSHLFFWAVSALRYFVWANWSRRPDTTLRSSNELLESATSQWTIAVNMLVFHTTSSSATGFCLPVAVTRSSSPPETPHAPAWTRPLFPIPHHCFLELSRCRRPSHLSSRKVTLQLQQDCQSFCKWPWAWDHSEVSVTGREEEWLTQLFCTQWGK